MTAPRDKLGEFILVAEAFNRYEEFAALAANYATVDEAHPADAGPAAIDLYRDAAPAAADERRLLVRSDRVYGVRRPVEAFAFGLAFSEATGPHFLWEHETTQQANGGETHRYDAGVALVVRAVLTDFDPATITWEAAYGEEGLAFSAGEMSLDVERASFTVQADAGAHVPPLDPADPVVVRVKSADLVYPGAEWRLCPEFLRGLADGWNDETEIFGFEVRILPSAHFSTPGGSGNLDAAARWTGDADAALSYAIRR